MAGYKHLEILSDFEKYVRGKRTSAEAYYRYFLARLSRMFQYKNLPDTIPHEILDRYLFEFGIACITRVNDNLYVFSGNLGGPQDVYYRPTQFIISNPHIKVNGELFTANVPVYYTDDDSKTDVTPWSTNGVIMRNDSEWQGLHPLIARYSYLLAENVLTLRTADVMLRVLAMITAPSDKERAAAMEYLKSLEKGELAVIGDTPLVTEGVKLQSPPSNNGSYLTQFIEYQQYLKGSFYNEIGLSANYNMKREAIGKGESTLDSDSILPLCDDMLTCRREDIAKVNDMFGTNIEIEYSSAWLQNRLEMLGSIKSVTDANNPVGGVLGQPSESFGDVGNSSESGEIDGYSQNISEDTETGKKPVETLESDLVNQEETNDADDSVDNVDNNISDDDSSVSGSDDVLGDGDNISAEGHTDKKEDKEVEEDTTSRINDLSQDQEMTELLDKAMEDPMPMMNPMPMEGDEESDITDDKASSEDKGNDSES